MPTLDNYYPNYEQNTDVSAGKGRHLKLEQHIDDSWLMVALNSKIHTN